MDFLLLIYGTTVPTEMKRQRNRGVLGVERKLTINKENHGRVYAKPWFSFIYRVCRHSTNAAGAVALAIFNRKCDGPFLVEKVVNYACFGG